MTDQPRPPLWRVMVEAEHRTPLISENIGGGQSWLRRRSAAEIRAVAVYLEAIWAAQPPAPEIDDKDAPGFFAGMNVAQEIHREGTLNILRGEAIKAEAGE